MAGEFDQRAGASSSPDWTAFPAGRCRMPQGAFYAFPDVSGPARGGVNGQQAARLGGRDDVPAGGGPAWRSCPARISARPAPAHVVRVRPPTDPRGSRAGSRSGVPPPRADLRRRLRREPGLRAPPGGRRLGARARRRLPGRGPVLAGRDRHRQDDPRRVRRERPTSRRRLRRDRRRGPRAAGDRAADHRGARPWPRAPLDRLADAEVAGLYCRRHLAPGDHRRGDGPRHAPDDGPGSSRFGVDRVIVDNVRPRPGRARTGPRRRRRPDLWSRPICPVPPARRRVRADPAALRAETRRPTVVRPRPGVRGPGGRSAEERRESTASARWQPTSPAPGR